MPLELIVGMDQSARWALLALLTASCATTTSGDSPVENTGQDGGSAICSSVDHKTFYADADQDGFGDPDVIAVDCDMPSGFVTNALDCNDEDPLINPDAGNCGACAGECEANNTGSVCQGGSCVLGTCDANWGNCNDEAEDGCETPLATMENCGSCGDVCNSDQICDGNACVDCPKVNVSVSGNITAGQNYSDDDENPQQGVCGAIANGNTLTIYTHQLDYDGYSYICLPGGTITGNNLTFSGSISSNNGNLLCSVEASGTTLSFKRFRYDYDSYLTYCDQDAGSLQVSGANVSGSVSLSDSSLCSVQGNGDMLVFGGYSYSEYDAYTRTCNPAGGIRFSSTTCQ
jgi:hypothetical protein